MQQTTTNVSIYNYHGQFNKSLGFNRNISINCNVIALFSTHSPTHLRRLSWEKLFSFLVIKLRVLCYQPSCQRFCSPLALLWICSNQGNPSALRRDDNRRATNSAFTFTVRAFSLPTDLFSHANHFWPIQICSILRNNEKSVYWLHHVRLSAW